MSTLLNCEKYNINSSRANNTYGWLLLQAHLSAYSYYKTSEIQQSAFDTSKYFCLISHHQVYMYSFNPFAVVTLQKCEPDEIRKL